MTALRILLVGLAAALVPAGIAVRSSIEPAFAAPDRSVQEPAAANGDATKGDKAGVKKDDDDDDTPDAKPDPSKPGQAKADEDDDQSAAAKARFPQPVQVGQLIGRDVLQPLESQPLLGHVRRLVRKPDGAIDVIVDYGGWFGWGARPIAVPLSAMALLGADMSIFGYRPDQLATFPTVTADAGQVLPAGETIQVGLTKPAH